MENNRELNKVVGIDEIKVDSVIRSIMINTEQLGKRFEQLDSVIDELAKYYKSDSFSKFIISYQNLHDNYETIKKNILSYANDLGRVKAGYLNIAEQIRSDIRTAAKFGKDY